MVLFKSPQKQYWARGRFNFFITAETQAFVGHGHQRYTMLTSDINVWMFALCCKQHGFQSIHAYTANWIGKWLFVAMTTVLAAALVNAIQSCPAGVPQRALPFPLQAQPYNLTLYNRLYRLVPSSVWLLFTLCPLQPMQHAYTDLCLALYVYLPIFALCSLCNLPIEACSLPYMSVSMLPPLWLVQSTYRGLCLPFNPCLSTLAFRDCTICLLLQAGLGRLQNSSSCSGECNPAMSCWGCLRLGRCSACHLPKDVRFNRWVWCISFSCITETCESR